MCLSTFFDFFEKKQLPSLCLRGIVQHLRNWGQGVIRKLADLFLPLDFFFRIIYHEDIMKNITLASGHESTDTGFRNLAAKGQAVPTHCQRSYLVGLYAY